ncbi:hypothetical protein [Actinoplanes sp. HUAS TT8]|uniref:hypothetical protein n=1 Tax=Actinoplanes sp. HUAS TT8 TaxID=3447453 RepID=UPI003F524264
MARSLLSLSSPAVPQPGGTLAAGAHLGPEQTLDRIGQAVRQLVEVLALQEPDQLRQLLVVEATEDRVDMPWLKAFEQGIQIRGGNSGRGGGPSFGGRRRRG